MQKAAKLTFRIGILKFEMGEFEYYGMILIDRLNVEIWYMNPCWSVGQKVRYGFWNSERKGMKVNTSLYIRYLTGLLKLADVVQFFYRPTYSDLLPRACQMKFSTHTIICSQYFVFVLILYFLGQLRLLATKEVNSISVH